MCSDTKPLTCDKCGAMIHPAHWDLHVKFHGQVRAVGRMVLTLKDAFVRK